MPSEVILPRVDMDMATGKISKWLVEPGAIVSKGQPIFEIETDKAAMEIEAEASGTIRDLTEAGAADIPVGSVVARIFGETEPPPAAQAIPASERDIRPAPSPAAPALPAKSESASLESRTVSGGRERATPLARRLARAQGVELGTLVGSGPRGRIQAADIAARRETALAHFQSASNAPPAAAAHASNPTAAAQLSAGLKRLRGGVGRPFLLVHGFGSDLNGWRPFLQGRSLERPVYALDLPGHGAAALGDVAGFDDLVEAVAVQLAGLDGADVMAHSLGGAVMTAIAGRSLADLRSLLLLAPAGLGPDINGAFVNGYLDAGTEASLAPWMGELVADPHGMPLPFVQATLKLRAGTDRVASQRRLAAAVFPDGTQAFSTRADLARLRLPTRIVFGTADRIIPARHATGLPPLVALHLLPGIGHMPYLEAADLVAEILTQNARA